MLRALLVTVVASSLSIVVALQPATPPRDLDPHEIPVSREDAEASCGELLDYQDELFGTFSSHADFMDFFGVDVESEVQALNDDEVEAILDDGNALIDDLEALEPPVVYVDAHQGIIDRFAFEVDYITFIAVDTSIAPDINSVMESLRLIYDGEVATAETCPDEVEEAGGFVFIDPADLEESVN